MTRDGNCARIVMASSASDMTLEATLRPPSGAPASKRGAGALDLLHCPDVTGEHAVALTGPSSGYAHAVLDCPPARERYREDPEHNGGAFVSARLEELQAKGCARILLAPERISGPRSLTSQIERGPFCAVIVAATGVDGAQLGVNVRSPLGEKLLGPAAAAEIERVLCATTAGPHKIEIQPTTAHYYTVAGVDCAKAVATKLQASR
jgi:hypothetical protein